MVRNYKRKGTVTQEYDEEVMISAIKEVVQGMSTYRNAALKYNLKMSTLGFRVKQYKSGIQKDTSRTFYSKHTSMQVFSLEEEARFNDYIMICCKMLYGLTQVQIRKLTYEYAKVLSITYPAKWDENQMAGLDWMRKYMERNTNISLRNIGAARSCTFDKTAITEFYNNMTNIFGQYHFTADRILNFGTCRVSTVLGNKVLAPESQKKVDQIVSSESGELVIFGGIISASGNTIPPLFVFPRMHYESHILDGAPAGSIGAANKSGYINTDIFVSVLNHIQVHTLCTKENPILLLCNNHESHVSVQAITYARDNGIIFVFFPSHTSHLLQPLDVGVFGPFMSKLKLAFDIWHMDYPGEKICIYNIPKLVKFAYFESFTAKNITCGFIKSGISPFKKIALTNEGFSPDDATVLDYENHLKYLNQK